MLQPCGKRIIIEPIAHEEKKSVIIVKEEAPQTFKVLAIGDEVTKVNVGDIIFLAAFSTSEFTFRGHKYTLSTQDSVIAKMAV